MLNALIARQLHQEALEALAATQWKHLQEVPPAGRRLQSRLSWILRRLADRLEPADSDRTGQTGWAS